MKTFLTVLLMAFSASAFAETATYKGVCNYMDLTDHSMNSHEVRADIDGDAQEILEALNEMCSWTCGGNKSFSGCYVGTYSKVEDQTPAARDEEPASNDEYDFRY